MSRPLLDSSIAPGRRVAHVERMERFQATLPEHQHAVVCVRCGSCILDQNAWNELRCYTCGNTLPWDATRFTVVRLGFDEEAIGDFESNLKAQERMEALKRAGDAAHTGHEEESVNDGDLAYAYVRGVQDERMEHEMTLLTAGEQALIVRAFLVGLRQGRHQEIHEDANPAPEGRT